MITLEQLPDTWPTLTRVQQAEVVLAMQEAGMTQPKIAVAIGINPRLVKSRVADARVYALRGEIPTGTVELEIDRSSVIDAEMDRRDRVVLMDSARKTVTNEVVAQGIRDEIYAALRASTEIEESVMRFKKESMDYAKRLSAKADGLEAAIQHVSDLHHCRYLPGVIDESTTAGALMQYQRTASKLLHRQRRHAHVETLYLFLNGDNAHGLANYKAQSREVTGTWSQQIARTALLLIDHINKERTQYEKIIVTVNGGNHGKKSKDDDLMTENAEFEIGRIIEARFYNCDDVDVHVADGTFWQIRDILGRRILATHGDMIKGAGNPQALVDAVKRWEDVLPPFDDVVMGHFHRQMKLPLPRRHGEMLGRFLYVGGTASIEDKFLETFGSSPSLQYWFMFCNGTRVTASYDVDLYPPLLEPAA